MPSKSNYGTVVTVYSASESSGFNSPSTPRTPLLGAHRCKPGTLCHCGYDCGSDEDEQLTEAEREAYEQGLLTWERASDWRFWVRKDWVPFYLAGLGLLAAVSFVAIYHREIVERLMPVVERVRKIRYGWIVPIAAMVVCSFPPLFGSEIIMILAGVVWGVRGGCAIAAAGTIIGELACFTMFRTCCRARAGRFSRQSLNYSCLSRVVSNGGLFVAWVVRLSAIPTHVSTTIFAICGLEYTRFLMALVFSLPKQFIAVYVGVMVTSSPSRDDIVLSNVVLGTSIIITLGALWYIHRQMLRVRKRVLIDMRDDLLRHGIPEPSPDEYLVWTPSGFRPASAWSVHSEYTG